MPHVYLYLRNILGRYKYVPIYVLITAWVGHMLVSVCFVSIAA